MSSVYTMPNGVSIVSTCPTISTTCGTNTSWVNISSTTTTCTQNTAVVCPTAGITNNVPVSVPYIPDHITLGVGKARTITFPDGTVIDFRKDGSFEIFDQYAKKIYSAARCYDFNPFLNASDKLEEFIKFCGSVGVRQGDMLGIPIKSFVQWLVIEAAKADGEEAAALLALPKPDIGIPRCRTCGRFMSPQLKADRIDFCRPECLEVKLNSNRSKHNGYQTTAQVHQAATASTEADRQVPAPS